MLSVSISDTPPANTTILSFTLPITGIKLTTSTGTDAAVFSPGSPSNFELTRLQSDSDVVVTNASIPAGHYTSLTVALGSPSGVFINASSSAVGSCAAGAVCNLTGTFTSITVPINITLNSNANQWLDLDFNYNNAIDTSGPIKINLGLANVLAVSTSIPAGIPSGDFANVDDFTGQVLATPTTANGITLKSTVRGNLTATINSSTQVFDPQGLCGAAGGSLSCIGVGSIVSLQGVLDNTGHIVATSLDVLDKGPSPVDEVEGTIYPSSCNGGSNFGMVLSDSSITTGGSPLATSGFGAGVCLTVSPTATFLVDFGILTGQPGLPAATGPGFRTTSDLLAGQTVRAKITGAATGTNGVNATATAMILRFSRLTGTVGSVSGAAFTIGGLPSYITAFAVSPSVQTYTNATLFENAASLSGTVSISALFFNPAGGPTQPLQAAKVRQP